MAIYNIFDQVEKNEDNALFSSRQSPYIDEHILSKKNEGGSFFSRVAARFFFFLLLCADILWMVYSLCSLAVKLVIWCALAFRLNPLKKSVKRTYLSLKRSLVCCIALFVALFSPALGIMFSYMYFLMYDKEGVDEIVPSSLKEQFDEMFS